MKKSFIHIIIAPLPIEIENPYETPIIASMAVPQGQADFKTPCSGPDVYNREAEEKGTENYPPAKYQNYLPTWDREQMLVARADRSSL